MVRPVLRSTPDVFPPRDHRRERRARLRRVLVGSLGLVFLVLLGLAAWVGLRLVRSRAQLDGELQVDGLRASVRIERDADGVPTLHAEDRADAAFALGFVHAQERFFQMDLLRRSAAGELAALIGGVVLDFDRALRVHRFRARAQRIVANLPRAPLLQTYADGVNAGLQELGAAPYEYLLLRSRPEPWKPEDTILVVLAMYLDLQPNEGGIESSLGVAYEVLPRALADFLAQRGTRWDAPLRGEAATVAPIPDASVFDLRRQASGGATPTRLRDTYVPGRDEPEVSGSNSWAVAGSLCVDGAALLAGDMHLSLGVPNLWYRASLSWNAPEGRSWRVTGVTLPGTPVVVSGSNGSVAWAFTNAMVDVSDLVVLEPADDSGRRYLTPDGVRAFETHVERIAVRGAAVDTLRVDSTIWGPVVDRDHTGRQRAYRWVAHDIEAVNLGLLDMETAVSLEAALDFANRTRIPAQNCIVAAHDGRIGWTLMGPVPRRFGFEGRLPSSWADGTRGWNGLLAAPEVPRIVDPPDGRLWTANARVLGARAQQRVGDGGYVLGARAQQIRDALRELDNVTAHDMLHLQLDDRAVFLGRWQALLLDTLRRTPGLDPQGHDAARRVVENWGARASIESVGYRIVRAFRDAVTDAVFEPLLARCREVEPRLRPWHFRQREAAVWALVEARPPHLLEPRFDSWDALMSACVDSTLSRLRASGALTDRTWGERNTSRIRHPLSRALPFVSRWLDMKPRPLPGDSNMPRVQSPTHGASQRFVVAPGREAEGFFHMPCGQSGHPLSPFYRSAQHAWEEGLPTPFLPGPRRYTLSLTPTGDAARSNASHAQP